MRQQHRGQACILFRLMLFQPKDFWGGESRQDRVTQETQSLLRATQLIGNLFAFRGGGGVAPEFGGANDVSFLVQRDEAMLLATDSNGAHFSGVRSGAAQRLAQSCGG